MPEESSLEKLRRAQLGELQAQINPHFIFNTLQLINLSILKRTHEDTVETRLISLLSELLHTSYDTKNFIIPVSEEIHNLEMFTEIQEIRYNGRLKANYHIDEECLDFYTLKLMLQPLAENCIVHGFSQASDRKDEWIIDISCRLDDNFVTFVVKDNGNGMNREQLDEIRNKLSSPNLTNRNIGLPNVNYRLQLLFGSRYTISIDSAPETGTTITIRHPASVDMDSLC